VAAVADMLHSIIVLGAADKPNNNIIMATVDLEVEHILKIIWLLLPEQVIQ
jgi:hypothetical protein